MANYPVITFDENTNYEEAELIVKSMYDCVLAQGDVCCKSKAVSDMLCEADVKRRAMSINKEFGNTDRYEANVKDLYNLLYNSAYCYDSNNPIVVPVKIATWDATFASALEVNIDEAGFSDMDTSGVFEYSILYEVRGKSGSVTVPAFAKLQFVQDGEEAYTDDFRFIVDSNHPFYNNASEITIVTDNYVNLDYTLDNIGGSLGTTLSTYVQGSVSPSLTDAGCPYNISDQSCYLYNGNSIGIQIQQSSQGQVTSASIKANGTLCNISTYETLEGGLYRRYIFVPLASSISFTEFIIN